MVDDLLSLIDGVPVKLLNSVFIDKIRSQNNSSVNFKIHARVIFLFLENS